MQYGYSLYQQYHDYNIPSHQVFFYPQFQRINSFLQRTPSVFMTFRFFLKKGFNILISDFLSWRFVLSRRKRLRCHG